MDETTTDRSGEDHSPNQGLLLVDKPAGMTSHDVVQHVRRIYGERSIGHLGTLDPLLQISFFLGFVRLQNEKRTHRSAIPCGPYGKLYFPRKITSPCPTIWSFSQTRYL